MRYMQTTGIAALLALSSAAVGQVPSFDELDADADGYISRNEAGGLPCLAANYDKVKPSDDKGLNRSEFRAAVAEYCQLRA